MRGAPAGGVSGTLVETDLRSILFGEHGGPVIETLFRALCEHPYGLTNLQLRALIWPAAREPESAISCVQVAAHSFNRRAAKVGLWLRITGSGGPGSIYRLYLARPKSYKGQAESSALLRTGRSVPTH